jgi:hypothetical protein
MEEVEKVPINDAETQRAEEIVDQAAQLASVWVAKLGHDLLRTMARAREEAEDTWAKAQDLANQQRG